MVMHKKCYIHKVNNRINTLIEKEPTDNVTVEQLKLLTGIESATNTKDYPFNFVQIIIVIMAATLPVFLEYYFMD